MKLLLIGAGYVGMALLHELKNQPYEMFITTTSKNRIETLKVFGQVLLLDENSDQTLSEWIALCDGAIILVAPSNSRNYEETYLHTAKKISFALENRQTPFYLIYTGSTGVYEGLQSEWVTEEMHLNPESTNAKILLETERYYLNSKATTCILRLGGIYGPLRDWKDRARKLSGKEMPGTGDEPTNHIHLNDITAAITYCLDNCLSGIYNLVNDEHRTRKLLYTTLCNEMQIPPPTWNSNLQNNKGYKVSNQKIRKAGFNC